MTRLALALVVALAVGPHGKQIPADAEFDVMYQDVDQDRICTATGLFQSNGNVYATVTCPNARRGWPPLVFPNAIHGSGVSQWLFIGEE